MFHGQILRLEYEFFNQAKATGLKSNLGQAKCLAADILQKLITFQFSKSKENSSF